MASTEDHTNRKLGPTRHFVDYDKGPHFRDRVECDSRPITEDLARRAVEEGDVEENPSGRSYDEWRFRRRIDGLDIVVAAGESEDPSVDLRIFTAFVDVADVETAWVSGTWEKGDIHAAAMLQCLNAGFTQAVDGLDPRRIDVGDPIPFHGHNLVWNAGHSEPFCLSCGHMYVDADDWKRLACE